MSMQLDLNNKAALEFNCNKNEELKKICQPLRKFGITTFTYARFYDGGKRLYICSSLDWVEYYIENHFQDVTEHIEHYIPAENTRYSLWASFKRNKVFSALNKLNIGNGFTIYEKFNEYIDYFDFASTASNIEINNFYLNNIQLLESFISDFKQKAAHIIEYDDETTLIVPKNEIIFEEIQRFSYVDESKIKNFMEEIQFHPVLNS